MKKILVSIIILIVISCSSQKKQNTLSILNWAEYIDEELIAQFERENKVKINYECVNNNEEMIAKFNNTKSYYDIIVPSEYLVGDLVSTNKIEALDYSKLPNVRNNMLDELKNLEHDPGNIYSVPLFWGVMGILYNKTKVNIKDMNEFDILFNEKYKKEIAMLDSPKENIGVALKKLGYSLNEHNIFIIKKAEELLKKQSPLVVGYFSDIAAKSLILNGEASIQLTWSGEALDAMRKDPNLDFYVPRSTNLWIDVMVIPSDAPNKELAHKFINFLYENEASYANYKETNYNSPNKNVFKQLKEEAKDNPEIQLYLEERFVPKNFSTHEVFKMVPKKIKEEQMRIYVELSS
ncbi:Spermidine/putrescine-binding protein [Borrelia nietonii YOR]|uniref:Spermidine/putrescine-binding protein n=1 Tax=Borrelia nietonii YOR TaxID=1293576 RepID=A0ABN4C3V9_9SPIR|nr:MULTISPECIES: ABC transporter substrate-binding protein [Borrelia]AHH03632.1 Spermidine/putrescine-binding protein [Borrelia nietonii YOR]AHH14134.1 Spermidine/putrescine-binding protein [Borrelia hermsii MTW]UPA09328.1 ABC transporter substrate-binding protein [Borrelia nietonii YOR]